MTILEAQSKLVPNSTPEQLILLNYLYENNDFKDIQKKVFQGAIAGSEFLALDVKKIYLMLECDFSYSVASILNSAGRIIYFDSAGVPVGYDQFTQPNYNSTTPVQQYLHDSLQAKNKFFWTIGNTNYDYMKFIGYVITLN